MPAPAAWLGKGRGAMGIALLLSLLAHAVGLVGPQISLPRATAAADTPLTARLLPPAIAELPVPSPPQRPVRKARLPAPSAVVVAEPGPATKPLLLGAPAAPRRATPELPEAKSEEATAPIQLASVKPSAMPDATALPPLEMPAQITLQYELRSSLVDGRAEYVWRKGADSKRYSIEGTIEADGFFATMFAGRLEQESRGELGARGLKPQHFSLRRGDSPAEFAEFKWDNGEIRHQRTRGEHVQPLVSNAQDLLSFIFQFAYEFNQPIAPQKVAFAITNARKMDAYEFRVVGTERLSLSIGVVDTVHVVREAAEPGDAYEAWLDPSRNYLPVKLKFMLGGRVQVEQVATRVEIRP